MTRKNKHTIVALVEDRPGVLNRIVSKVRQRNFNIESLAVGHSETPGLSRMTFVVDASTTDVEQVVKQVDKLIEVVRIRDISEEDHLSRELAMIKVATTPATRGEIIQIVDVFRAAIVDVSSDSLIVEVTGEEDKVDSLIRILEPYGIRELARTGRISMVRGHHGVTISEQDEEELEMPHYRGTRAPISTTSY
ncbi:MAG: acetolactate synthase small subunit [Chloroflexi bacterium]|nr:acetolactate synthase small subunit [Chloroflexota bacterium]